MKIWRQRIAQSVECDGDLQKVYFPSHLTHLEVYWYLILMGGSKLWFQFKFQLYKSAEDLVWCFRHFNQSIVPIHKNVLAMFFFKFLKWLLKCIKLIRMINNMRISYLCKHFTFTLVNGSIFQKSLIEWQWLPIYISGWFVYMGECSMHIWKLYVEIDLICVPKR